MMEQTNNSTETLLASFQAGNMAAFSQLYDLHINILFNYGLKLTIDKELLKDCIHFFCSCIRHIHTFAKFIA